MAEKKRKRNQPLDILRPPKWFFFLLSQANLTRVPSKRKTNNKTKTKEKKKQTKKKNKNKTNTKRKEKDKKNKKTKQTTTLQGGTSKSPSHGSVLEGIDGFPTLAALELPQLLRLAGGETPPASGGGRGGSLGTKVRFQGTPRFGMVPQICAF